MATQYEKWREDQREIKYARDCLLYADYTQELHKVYDRYLEIIEEILVDLSPQLDDDQYEGTTSWQYEDELKELKEKREKLEPIVMEKIEKEKHEEFLKDIGMNQEQYDAYLKEQAEEDKRLRNERIAKKRSIKPKK